MTGSLAFVVDPWNAFITQIATEVLGNVTAPEAVVTQVAAEILGNVTAPEAIVTQIAIEILREFQCESAPANLRCTQIPIEAAYDYGIMRPFIKSGGRGLADAATDSDDLTWRLGRTTVTLGDALNDMGGRLMDPHHVRWPVPELKISHPRGHPDLQRVDRSFPGRGVVCLGVAGAVLLPADRPADSPRADVLGGRRGGSDLLATPRAAAGRRPLGWNAAVQPAGRPVGPQEARDTFLLETGIVQTISQLPVSPFPSDSAVDLPEEIINLRRLGWLTADGIHDAPSEG